jgi:TonB family protein
MSNYYINRERKKFFKWVVSILLSILFNALLLFLLSFYFSIDTSEKDTKKKKDFMVVSLFDKSKLNNDKSKPLKTDKLALNNNDVKNETINRSKPRKTIVVRRVSKQAKPLKRKLWKRKKIEKPRKIKKGELVTSIIPSKIVKSDNSKKKGSKKKISKQKKGNKKLKLFPTSAEALKILEIYENDSIQNIASGKKNSLRAKKWIGASFFLRVREAIAQIWNPGKVYKKNDPDGSYYGFKNWVTFLKITLDSHGKILRIIIIKPSGLTFLDKEALRAVNAAGPFPNPPKEIINKKSGKITFKFGFIVEVTTKLDFKMFRF